MFYYVVPSKEALAIANEIASRKNLKLITLSSSFSVLESKGQEYVGPDKFLGLFKNASFVVTTSFHGTVFSTLFEKPFYTVCAMYNPRIEDLCGELHLSDRIIDSMPNVVDDDIDWENVNSRKDNLLMSSFDFLKNAVALTGDC